MTSHSEPPTLRLRGPADVVQAVPYLLGFHPEHSVVLIGLDAGRIAVTARLDLDDVVHRVRPEADVLADTLAAMRRGGAERFVAAVFDDNAVARARQPETAPGAQPDTERRWWPALADRVVDAVRAAGGHAEDVLLVADRRWWSALCTEPSCCPPEGRSVEGGSGEVAAAATYAGLVALPDRAAVAALLDPLPGAERARLLPAIAAAENLAVQAVFDGRCERHVRSVKRAMFAAARRDPPAELPEHELARFAAALAEPEVRDAAWLAIDDGRLDGRPLWRALARRLPDPYAAAPLFLYGWASWRDGDGAQAGIAARRALDSDPHYSAADLLLAALSQGIDPRQLPRLRRSA